MKSFNALILPHMLSIRGDDWVADHFDTTPVMSVYLLCFAISDFVYVESQTSTGIAVRWRTYNYSTANRINNYLIQVESLYIYTHAHTPSFVVVNKRKRRDCRFEYGPERTLFMLPTSLYKMRGLS